MPDRSRTALFCVLAKLGISLDRKCNDSRPIGWLEGGNSTLAWRCDQKPIGVLQPLLADLERLGNWSRRPTTRYSSVSRRVNKPISLVHLIHPAPSQWCTDVAGDHTLTTRHPSRWPARTPHASGAEDPASREGRKVSMRKYDEDSHCYLPSRFPSLLPTPAVQPSQSAP